MTYNIDLPSELKAYCQQVLALEAYQEWLSAAKAEAEVIVEEEIEL